MRVVAAVWQYHTSHVYRGRSLGITSEGSWGPVSILKFPYVFEFFHFFGLYQQDRPNFSCFSILLKITLFNGVQFQSKFCKIYRCAAFRFTVHNYTPLQWHSGVRCTFHRSPRTGQWGVHSNSAHHHLQGAPFPIYRSSLYKEPCFSVAIKMATGREENVLGAGKSRERRFRQFVSQQKEVAIVVKIKVHFHF